MFSAALALAFGAGLQDLPRWAGMSLLMVATLVVGMIGGRIFSLAAAAGKTEVSGGEQRATIL